jgi:hypothetical protein
MHNVDSLTIHGRSGFAFSKSQLAVNFPEELAANFSAYLVFLVYSVRGRQAFLTQRWTATGDSPQIFAAAACPPTAAIAISTAFIDSPEQH